MSARELASRLSLDQSHLSRIENGRRPASIETTARILGVLQTPPDECARILELARNASEPNWLAIGEIGIPAQLVGVLENERVASATIQWSPTVVPGLLQTPEYARALAEADDMPKHQADSLIPIRAARKEVLTSRNPPVFDGLIGEAALHEPVGSSRVMAEQLRHLISFAQRPNVTVRVVPLGVGWHPGCAGSFVLYDFPEAASVLHVEHYRSGVFVTDKDNVSAYREATKKIKNKALNRDDSLEFIATTIVEEVECGLRRGQLTQEQRERPERP